jgi:CheY-like chemotaxis protein
VSPAIVAWTAGGRKVTNASVLVVDDDPDTCANMSDILADAGYRVEVAYDGRAATEAVGRNGHRLALLDYKLPCMTGLELFRRLRDVKPDLVAVLVSGFVSPEVASAATKEGIRAVFHKPVDPAELVPVVDEAVGAG